MKKQKICIIGDGLTGLTTSLALKNSAVEIDLYYESFGEGKIDKRITAISESNYMFLKHIEKKLKSHLFWTCKKIHLYYERKSKLLNFLNFDKEEKSLMHIFENIKIKKEFRKLLKCKNIKLIKKKIKKINYTNGYILYEKKKVYYDLIILCLGSKSKLYDDLTNNRAIKKDYKEIAITGYIKHNSKLINPRQYFLDEGPLAFLPFKKVIKNKLSYLRTIAAKIKYNENHYVIIGSPFISDNYLSKANYINKVLFLINKFPENSKFYYLPHRREKLTDLEEIKNIEIIDSKGCFELWLLNQSELPVNFISFGSGLTLVLESLYGSKISQFLTKFDKENFYCLESYSVLQSDVHQYYIETIKNLKIL